MVFPTKYLPRGITPGDYSIVWREKRSMLLHYFSGHGYSVNRKKCKKGCITFAPKSYAGKTTKHGVLKSYI